MKNIKTTLRLALLAAMTWPAAEAMANSDTRCEFGPLKSNLLKVFVRDMGTLYVPRDARVGTLIGPADSYEQTIDQNNLRLRCFSYGVRMNFDMKAARGVHPPMPPIDGQNMDGHVLRTNIPGLGAIVRVQRPFRGDPGHWNPIGRNPPLVPFAAYYDSTLIGGVSLLTFAHEVTLVKTGDLAPGVHQLDGQLITGHLDFQGMGQVMEYTLRATIIQSQCEVLSDAVSANPVKLGEWSTSDFTGPGFTTTATPFQIRLSSCQVDPDPDNETLATIELEGRDGSQPIGPVGEHVFSLTSDSDARGMGIQMLHNGQPMPLNTEIGLRSVQDGTVPLNFEARFYQTEPSSNLRAGLAKGALNFTIRYR